VLPALGSAVYKGVLFSTTAQPGWKHARWLGGYLTNSAVLLGCAQMMVLAWASGHPGAADRMAPAFGVVLVMNLIVLAVLMVEMAPALAGAVPSGRLMRDAAIVAVGGFVVPAGLAFWGAGWVSAAAGLGSLVIASLVVRHLIVMLPHLARERAEHRV
jgi:hypothetical protein